MKLIQTFMALMFLLGALSFGGAAYAGDEHGGESVEESGDGSGSSDKEEGDEHAGDKA